MNREEARNRYNVNCQYLKSSTYTSLTVSQIIYQIEKVCKNTTGLNYKVLIPVFDPDVLDCVILNVLNKLEKDYNYMVDRKSSNYTSKENVGISSHIVIKW